MSTRSINKVYGLLTDGDSTYRKTTVNRDGLPVDTAKLLEALLPKQTHSAAKRMLAEFYIRLCDTNEELSKLLTEKDPVNSYKITSIYEAYPDGSIDLDGIVTAIKALALPGEGRSFMLFDYIRNALTVLLRSL